MTIKVGDRVTVDEDAPAFGATDHAGETGFVTEIHRFPKGCEPPFAVDFGNGEIEDYYEYELEKSTQIKVRKVIDREEAGR